MPDDELERRENSIYKFYNGKKYSYKEWKAFEQEQWLKRVSVSKKKKKERIMNFELWE